WRGSNPPPAAAACRRCISWARTAGRWRRTTGEPCPAPRAKPGPPPARGPAAGVEPGPAAGVVAAALVARQTGRRNLLSFDMGGTTAKASLIRDGRYETTPEYEVGGGSSMTRGVHGPAHPIRLPVIDLAEVSAGGGSIAWIDRAGALRVGPKSAGADPGPACY